jgi:uncharacterized cupredoxin-like copper-binding protein
MKKYILILIATSFALLAGGLSQAVGKSTSKSIVISGLNQEAIEVHLLLGGKDKDCKLIPETLMLQAGKPYKLFIENRSDIAHALSLPEFSAMIEGSSAPAFPYLPEEIEVTAGQTVEWFFVPVKAGRYKMRCAGRTPAEAGMVGSIVVN